MTNKQDIVPVENHLNLPAGLATDGLAKYGASEGNTSLGDWLRCNGKTGELTYGSEGTALARGTKAAVLLGLAEAGFIKWADGKPEDQAWQRLVDGPDLKALRQTLGNTDPSEWEEVTLAGLPQDPYRESVKLPLVQWPDGKLFTYSNSSGSGVRAVKRLARGCVAQMRAAPETTAGHVPIVELDVGHWQHSSKTVGKIYFLTLEVCDWIPAKNVMHALVAQGEAGALGIPNNLAALNADLGTEPQA